MSIDFGRAPSLSKWSATRRKGPPESPVLPIPSLDGKRPNRESALAQIGRLR